MIARLVDIYCSSKKFKAQETSKKKSSVKKVAGEVKVVVGDAKVDARGEAVATFPSVKKMKHFKRGLYIIKECKVQYEGQDQDEW